MSEEKPNELGTPKVAQTPATEPDSRKPEVATTESLDTKNETKKRVCLNCGWARWFRLKPKKVTPSLLNLPSSSSHDTLCLACKSPNSSSSFCSTRCLKPSYETKLIEIPISHARFVAVRSLFHENWTYNDSTMFVHHIYKIIIPKAIYKVYQKYRSSVEFGSKSKRLERGNEVLAWHGTSRECNLGDNGKTTLCSSRTCGLCGVIGKSYKMNRSPGGGTYGMGIYTSPSSSVSNTFSHNQIYSRRTRCLLLNRVVVGVSASPHNTSPPYGADYMPKGTHSFVDNSEGYSQLVVFKEAAIRPAYLVVYSPEPPKPPRPPKVPGPDLPAIEPFDFETRAVQPGLLT